MKDIFKDVDKKIKYGVIGGVVLITVIVLLILFTPKTLKLTREEVLLDGFTSKENLVVKISLNKIKSIKLTKEINLSEYYDELGTYYDSLEKVLNNGYSYLDSDYNLKREDYKMIVNIDTRDKGIVLNNLSIKYNGDDKTTLRYDVIMDLDDESAVKVGDAISKTELKEKLKKWGYN
ncbi:MAG: hypothetical protein OSJ70_08690 [Bacilli bacterium]|nr:hypothetical protein [Bacilli bacterium]